jgi:hypothetical protein
VGLAPGIPSVVARWPLILVERSSAASLSVAAGKADLQSLDFSEPSVLSGFRDAVGEVADDLDPTRPLAGVEAQDRASDAGFSELARRRGRLNEFEHD